MLGFVNVASQLPKCTEACAKLHKIAYQMPQNRPRLRLRPKLRWGAYKVPQTLIGWGGEIFGVSRSLLTSKAVFNGMRYLNPRFTYLPVLTYLLCPFQNNFLDALMATEQI